VPHSVRPLVAPTIQVSATVVLGHVRNGGVGKKRAERGELAEVVVAGSLRAASAGKLAVEPVDGTVEPHSPAASSSSSVKGSHRASMMSAPGRLSSGAA
jgi:hypothetical protein